MVLLDSSAIAAWGHGFQILLSHLAGTEGFLLSDWRASTGNSPYIHLIPPTFSAKQKRPSYDERSLLG